MRIMNAERFAKEIKNVDFSSTNSSEISKYLDGAVKKENKISKNI